MKLRFLLTIAVTVLLAAAPAYAGFTLITPDYPAAAPVSAVPVTPVQTAPINSFQVQPQFQPQATVNTNPVARTHVGPAMVELAPMPAPSLMPPQTVIAAAPVAAPLTGEPVVKGFGKDIPLVIAAQQIAPADREIAFGQGVDPSMPVSWRGGQPWHTVLSDALNKRGLKMTEQGTLLFISQSKTDLGTSKASLLMQPKDAFDTTNSAPANPPPMASAATAPVDLMPPAGPPMNSNVMVTPLPPVQAPMLAQTVSVIAPPAVKPAVTQITPAMAQPNLPPVISAPVPATVAVAPLPDTAQPVPVSAIATVSLLTGPSIAVPAHVPEQTTWHASAGQTLKQTLETWSHSANITLRWDSEYDYPVQASVTMDGDYESAVRSLLRGFSNAQPQPIARLYHPSHGMVGVLLVSDRGNDMSTSQ